MKNNTLIAFLLLLMYSYSLCDTITKDTPKNSARGSGCFQHGDTYTYISNKTPFAIEITDIHGDVMTQPGSSTQAYTYKQIGTISPGNKARVLTIPRGCPDFKETIDFDIVISLPYVGEIILQEKVLYSGSRGNDLLGTSTLAGLSLASGAKDKYTGDNSVEKIVYGQAGIGNIRSKQSKTFHKGSKSFTVTYYAYFTGGYDDIWCEITYH